jgi:hypothetical protein
MALPYSKVNWTDNVTPENAANLGKMDQGIKDLDDSLSQRGAPLPLVEGQWLKVAGGAMVWAPIAIGDLPSLAGTYQVRTEKAAAGGYASLDTGTKVPVGQIPDLAATYQARSERAQANGYPSLDATGKVPAAQLPAASGGMTRVYNDTLAAAAATISIPIPANLLWLVIYILARGTSSGTGLDMSLRLNGDTGANYAWEMANADSATVNASASTGQTSFNMAATVPGSNQTAGRFGYNEVLIPDPGGSAGFKTLRGWYGGFGGISRERLQLGYWANTAPITSIDLALSTGNFDVGTRVIALGT